MSAALSRFANPAANLGHAGPEAPVLDDPRLELTRSLMADLPALQGLEQPDPTDFRAALLERDLATYQERARVMRAALVEVMAEVRPGPNQRRHDSDSHLPEHLVTLIRRALILGSL